MGNKRRLIGAIVGFWLTTGAEAEPLSFFRNMEGCFSVTYNYVEDGEHDAFFQPVLEKASLSEEGGVVHIRRTQILEGEAQAHWREEWRELNAAQHLWEQTVYGPFEDFRYRCSGIIEGELWRCEASRSPKPRRDIDRPYLTLDRENTLKVNPKRWIHMQKNNKRKADGSLYASELGWNRYERKEDSLCLIR